MSDALSAQMVDPLEQLQHHQSALPVAGRGHRQVLSQRARIAEVQKETECRQITILYLRMRGFVLVSLFVSEQDTPQIISIIFCGGMGNGPRNNTFILIVDPDQAADQGFVSSFSLRL